MNIAIVIQRYGPEINGGAELHARQLAEHLSRKHSVDVLTTKSLSYLQWGNYYKQDKEILNNVTVRRFFTYERNWSKSRLFYRLNRDWSKLLLFLYKLGCKKIFDKKIVRLPFIFKPWIKFQGPYTPQMMEYINENKDKYDVFIFFTYLYYPTNTGLPLVKEKNVFIPTAHDEKPFYFPGYGKVFENASFIMYNSKAEKELVERVYIRSKKIKNNIAGVGIQPFQRIKNSRPPISEPYIVYIGRVDTSKNVHELAQYFIKYKSENKKTHNLKLVLIGKAEKTLPETGHPDIIQTGFITDEEKNRWLQHALALIIPSKHESLSMVTLEAMSAGIPVIANASSKVLEDHIRVSEAGFTYKNYNEFATALNKILTMTEKEREIMENKGKDYVKNNYQWDAILKKFEEAFAYIQQSNKENRHIQ